MKRPSLLLRTGVLAALASVSWVTCALAQAGVAANAGSPLSTSSAGVAQAQAQALSAATQASALKLEQFTLANGMTVIVQPDHRAPTAVQMVWVRVGSMDEVSGTSGIAHMLEHMMFKGTPTVPAGEFSRRVAALGGQDNAFTSLDHTGFYQQVPADKLLDVMKLESDRFANNQWPDSEFAPERAVVQEERRMRTDEQPRSRLYELLMAQTFVASPYRRPIIGWMNDIESFTADDVRDFHHRWYVPANAALVVAGDVDPRQVREWAEQTYGRIESRPVPTRKPQVEPQQQGIRRFELKAVAQQPYLVMAYKIPKLASIDADDAASRDALALTMLAAVLDGYDGSRLDKALTQGIDRKGKTRARVADGVNASSGLTGRGPQLFTFSAVPAEGKTVADVEAAWREQIALVAREGVGADELRRVKTQWKASQIYQRDSVMSQAQDLGSNWIDGLPTDASDRLIQRLEAVTSDDVKSVAAKYFGDDQLTVGVLVPQRPEPGQEDKPTQRGTQDNDASLPSSVH